VQSRDQAPTNETKSWICDVNEEGVLLIPDELWNDLGWEEGQEVYWHVFADDKLLLTADPDYAPDDSQEQVDPEAEC